MVMFHKHYDVLDNKTSEPLVTSLTWEEAVKWQMERRATGQTHLRRGY
jgi:hypothetical protein